MVPTMVDGMAQTLVTVLVLGRSFLVCVCAVVQSCLTL